MFSVKQLKPTDWRLYKNLWLQALNTDPNVFSLTAEEEKALPDIEWQNDLKNNDNGIFALYSGNKPIGITRISFFSKNKTVARVGAAWIATEHRQKGLAESLFNACLDWAFDRPSCKLLEATVRKSNTASLQTCNKLGFIQTKAVAKTWADGVTEDEIYLEYKIDKPLKPKPPTRFSENNAKA